MPVHETVPFGKANFDQASSARTPAALPGLRGIYGAVRGTHQPVSGAVKKMVGLVIHLHRHMRAAIQIGMDLAAISNGKGPTTLRVVNHVKRYPVATVNQIKRVAQGIELRHGRALSDQALPNNQW
jgi:hypothetical protein